MTDTSNSKPQESKSGLFRHAVILVGFTAFSLAPTIAIADYSHCRVPRAIDPPVTLDTDSEANEWLEKMDFYSAEVEGYFLCLAKYAEDNNDTISSEERDAIGASHADTVAQAQRIADKWNRAYTGYLRKFTETSE